MPAWARRMIRSKCLPVPPVLGVVEAGAWLENGDIASYGEACIWHEVARNAVEPTLKPEWNVAVERHPPDAHWNRGVSTELTRSQQVTVGPLDISSQSTSGSYATALKTAS